MREAVVITGVGCISPIGNDVVAVEAGLRAGASGVRHIAAWATIDGLGTRLAAPVIEALDARALPRRNRRSMGPQAVFAALAAQQAVADAGLDESTLRGGRTGVSVGSTLGSLESQHTFYEQVIGRGTVAGLRATLFPQFMGHTCAANVALLLGITGRVIAPISACTSGSQAIGAGLEALRLGVQDVMICGGADEAHYTAAATFGTAGAASVRFNDTPDRSPRPFDADRDGLVVGEGAGIVILERLSHAHARGARILGELVGYATTCDGTHLTQPQQVAMERTMRLALTDAGHTPDEVGYVNAHATATRLGDPVEAAATRAVFGGGVPISSTKGHTGHTLGACGALETIFCLLMLRGGFVAGTRNLDRVDPDCDGLDHVRRAARDLRFDVAVNNNFAFGGVNTSLVIRRWAGG